MAVRTSTCLTLLLLAPLAACRSGGPRCSPDPRPPSAAPRDLLDESDYPQLVLLDGLETQIVRDEIRVDRSDAGEIRRVVAPIRSVGDRTLRLQYRVIYRDGKGAEITANPRWHSVVVEPRLRRSITDVPVESGAMDFFIEIRKARQ